MPNKDALLDQIVRDLRNLDEEQLLDLQISVTRALQDRFRGKTLRPLTPEEMAEQSIEEMEELFNDFLSPEEMEELKQHIRSGERFIDETPLPKNLSDYIIEDRG
jgi:anti-sigma28 factor (negative regulator of flagellin synthesis)